MLDLLSKNDDKSVNSDHKLRYRLIFVFLILCLFYTTGLLNAAEPGLPFTEDFVDTNLKDISKSNANWATEAVYLAWRKQIYGAFSAPDEWIIDQDTGGSFEIALGDMDGDGDLDVVASSLGGNGNRLYMNNGSIFPFFGVIALDIGSDTGAAHGIALGDVDSDGDLDIVAGKYSQTNKLYLNNGTSDPFSEVSGINIGSDTDITLEIVLGDVDGDGDLDAVAGNWDQVNKLYLNDGTGNFSDFSAIGSDTGRTNAIRLGDMDGDGDLDVVAGNSGQTNKLYLNDGTGVFSDGKPIGLDTDPTSAIALGDIDGDGNLDVVAGNESATSKAYLNNGTADPFNGVVGTDIGSDMDWVFAIALGDVDGDGDLDVVAGYLGMSNKLYLNNGTDIPFNDVTGFKFGVYDGDNTRAIALGDVDGDGDLDVVVGNSDPNNKLYMNNGTENPFNGVTGTPITLDSSNTLSVAIGDVDGDSDLDVVAGRGGQNKLYLNDGIEDPFDSLESGTVIGSDIDNTKSIALGDMDGDGDLDIVAGNYEKTNKLYLNDGTGAFSDGTSIGLDEDGTYAIALGDVNNDEYLDVIVGNTVGQTNKLYLNNGTSDPFSEVTGKDITSDTDYTRAIALGYLNSDEYLDVVVGNIYSNKIYLNDGEGDPFDTLDNGTDICPAYSTIKIALGDVDGDGDLDMVTGNNSSYNKLCLNDGEGDPFDTADITNIGNSAYNTTTIALDDVDGDGDLDVVEGNAKAPNNLYLNKNLPDLFNGAIVSAIGLTTDDTYDVAIGDMDGDGDLDLVVGNWSNEVNKLYLNGSTALIPDLFYDTGHGIVTSLEVDTESLNNISNATLTAEDWLPVNTRIDYFLSNNGGERFFQVYSDREFFFPTKGNDLRWRAELHSLSPFLSPEIQEITITTRNIAPDVTAGGSLAYTEDDPATPIDGSINVSDIDNVNLEGAIITIISPGYQSDEDVLGFIDANNITGSWNSETGVLTLSGMSSVENYQAALRSVSYLNISNNPSENDRTVEFAVTDGELYSSPVTSTVTVARTNDAPQITSHDPIEPSMNQSGSAQISIKSSDEPDIYVTVNDPDNALEELSLIIQPGDNYLVQGNIVTPVENFFGDLTVPVIVYDGIEFGNIYEITIQVNDPTSPWVTSVDVLAGGRTSDISFNEPMGSSVFTASNYTLSGTGKGTLANNPNSIIHINYYNYRLYWISGEMKDGGDITITASGVHDAAGNLIGTPSSGTDLGGGIGTPPETSIDNGEGTYQSSVDVALSCTDTGGSGCSATYYSLDGSDPTVVYSGPITITEDTTLRFLSEDQAGNRETVHTQIYSIEIPTEITCNLSANTIIYGESFVISGSINPSPNAANEGINIQLIPSAGSAVSLSANADINGDFELFVDCSKIKGAGAWEVQTSWEGDESHLDATSDPQSLTVNQASSSLSLDVVAEEAIKVNSRPPIGGKFTPDPNCGGVIPENTPILIHVNDPDGGEPITLTAYANVNGQFLLDYDTCAEGETSFDFDQLGDWTLSAELEETDNFAGVITDPVTVRVVPTAGYAIIVQGRVSTNEGMESHHKTASFVYEKLRDRQILDEDIKYLSWMYDSDVDDIPSREKIQEAITIWARDRMDPDYVPSEPYEDQEGQPGDLYIIFIDHGWTAPSDAEEGIFYIYPDDPVTSTELSGWVNDLQDNLGGTASDDRNIVMLLGFCRAAAFMEELSHENRIIIASAAKDEASHRGPQDVDDNGVPLRDGEYFISEFFKSVSYGKSIKESFEDATVLTEAFTSSGTGIINAPYNDDSVQHPLLDDNGDQEGSNILSEDELEDGYRSQYVYIGASPPEGNDPGDVLVTKVNYAQFLGVEDTSVDLWAEVDAPGDLRLIWMEVKEPNYEPDPEEGVQVEMDTFKKGTQTVHGENISRYLWLDVGSGSDPADLFDIPGTYQVFYFAKDDVTGHVSPLVSSRVYKNKEGNKAPGEFNLITPLNEETVATVLPLMWEESIDTDDPPDPVTYTVEISEDIDFSSFVMREEGITDEFLFLDTEFALEDYTTYYWRVIAIDQYGEQTYSTEERSFNTDNTNGIPGYLTGVVIDIFGEGIGGATVETSAGFDTTTHSNGVFDLSHPSGEFTMTVLADGYQSESQPDVEILSERYTTLDFVLYSENDEDRDGYDDEDDNCPEVYNPFQEDSDEDGVGDECDGCPDDPGKTSAGQCGCGVADTDTDGDGTADCNDECPDDFYKTDPGQCGCGNPDRDFDGDGIADCLDTDDDDDGIQDDVDTDDDNDGMPDDWENDNGLDYLFDDAGEDADGDGFSNIVEYNKNTDPQDPKDHPARSMPWLPLLLGD